MDNNSQNNLPKVIFLDAVGTILGIKGSVGKVYADIAQRFGVNVAENDLNTAFYHVFYEAEPPIFPDTSPLEIPGKEYQWWNAIASQTFQHIGMLDQFSDFNSFFSELYSHFASAEPWYVYPDVLPALEYWQHQGVELGLVSNFDSRIYAVLQALSLDHFFSSITISTEVAAAKPEAKIFEIALEKHHCQPQETWHIGDNYEEDYQGAKAVGIRAILIDRDD